MKRGKKIALIVAGVLLLTALGAGSWLMTKVGPIGSGFVSKYLCSSTFISHRDPETVFREDIVPVNPLAKFFTYRIDRENKTVTSSAYGLFALTAIHRPGCGCSLVIGTSAEQMRSQNLVTPDGGQPPRVHAAGRPWPEGAGGPAIPAESGIDSAKIGAALDWAFEEPGPIPERRTRAVAIVYNGRLVAERYAPGFHKNMPLLGWSMSKSVTNALVGILVQEGRLDITRPAPVAEWQHPDDPRQRITLDQLLRMSSGLAFEEVYAPLHDATAMLYGSSDFAAYAASKPPRTAPDASWSYSSGTANIVARIVRRTAEKTHAHYYDFISEKLFDKIGMYSAVMEPDSSGTFVGSSYTFATPRDWARFGLLYLQDGVWNGERILPEGWVAYTTTPTPAAPRGEYGAHFWLNAGPPGDPGGRPWPDAPIDTFAASGFQEQKVIVVPSRRAVLVRFGATSKRSAWDTNEFIRRVLEAFPEE